MNANIESWIKQFVNSKVDIYYYSDNIVSLSDKKSNCLLVYVDEKILLISSNGISSFKRRKKLWKAMRSFGDKEVVEMEEE